MGVSNVFYKLVLFYKIFSKLQDAFYGFKKFELFFEISPVQVRLHKVPFGKGKLKQHKKTILLKIYLLLHFSSNLLQTFSVLSIYIKKMLLWN